MQNFFNIKTSDSQYTVRISQNILPDILSQNPFAILIIDSSLVKYISYCKNRYVEIDATEGQKDLSKMASIIEKLNVFGANRGSLLIGIGGGIIQDITCFCASIYMRGIKWLYFPTTTLGMMDSCIGGKSSINVLGIKNLVGNIYPSTGIYIDPIFISSLKYEHILAGIFEAIKICYTMRLKKSEGFYKVVEKSLDYLKNWNAQNLIDIVSISLFEKKWFIENDEFDKNERQLLNFGHTFGHAIESATEYQIPHGVAVGIGMLCAIELAKIIGSKPNEHRIDLQNAILKLLENSQSIEVFKKIDFIIFMKKFESDKKHQTDSYQVILPIEDSIFAITKIGLQKIEESKLLLKSAIESVMKLI